MFKNIFKRDIIDQIDKYLETDDVVVLHGARQVGKTSILLYLQDRLKVAGRPVYYLDLEDGRYKSLLDLGPGEFIKHLREKGFDAESRVFALVDEIQYLENPSSFLKLMADHHKNIKLIVSGSSSFAIKSKFKDSLVGRTVDFEVFNLSFREFLSFKKIPPPPESAGEMTAPGLEELISLYKEYALYGGYPKIILTDSIEAKEKYLQQIIDTYVRKDIGDLAGVRDIGKFNKLLEVLASQSGQLLNVREISSTCAIAKQTVEKYLFILENTYILKLVKPYSRNIRSELFKAPKIYFYDSGIMQMLWLKSLQSELMGNVLETSVFSDLAKKYSVRDVYYWRTQDKKEIDFILRRKASVLPIEVKMNFGQFNPHPVNYFLRRYALSEYRLVGLKGKAEGQFATYPWWIS